MLRRLGAWYDDAGLQAKLALQVVLSTALLFALMLPAVLYIQRRVILSSVEESGFRIADIFARSSVQAVLADDYLVMQHVVNGIASEKKVRYAMLLKDNGEVLVHTRAIERGRRYGDPISMAAATSRGPTLQRLVGDDGAHIYDFTVPVYVLDEKRASARVGLSIESELREIARTRNSILGFGLAVLALGLVWASYQGRRLARPVRALVHGTEEVARGNLDHRIPVSGARDEMGQLAQAFNHMTESVQALIETSREISSALDIDVVLESITAHALTLVRADVACIAPVERDGRDARVRVVQGAPTDGASGRHRDGQRAPVPGLARVSRGAGERAGRAGAADAHGGHGRDRRGRGPRGPQPARRADQLLAAPARQPGPHRRGRRAARDHAERVQAAQRHRLGLLELRPPSGAAARRRRPSRADRRDVGTAPEG